MKRYKVKRRKVEVSELIEVELNVLEDGKAHENVSYALDRLQPDPFIGVAAEETTYEIVGIEEGINNNDPQKIQEIVPEPAHRKKIVKTVTGFIPKKDSDYTLDMTFGSDSQALALIRSEAVTVKGLVGEIPQDEKEKLLEKTIQARARATINEEGDIVKLGEVLDYNILDEDEAWPLRTKQIHWKSKTFSLREQIMCGILIEDGMYILEYDPLRLRVAAESRDDVIKEFRQEFSMLWDEYAQAEDSELTEDAQEIKKHLLDIVQEVTES